MKTPLKADVKCAKHNIEYFSTGKCPECEREYLDSDNTIEDIAPIKEITALSFKPSKKSNEPLDVLNTYMYRHLNNGKYEVGHYTKWVRGAKQKWLSDFTFKTKEESVEFIHSIYYRV